MILFQLGDFTLRSGIKSSWRIECDALTPDDWAALAAMAAEVLPPFSAAVGVPRGGVPLARALADHCRLVDGPKPVMVVCEDVVTTGGSMEKFLAEMRADERKTPSGDTAGRIVREDYEVIGVCVFARGPAPDWVTPLFRMTSAVLGPRRVY